MTKKKITLNELKTLVKKIIKEEHTFTSKQLHSSDEEDRKGMIANTIESFYKLIELDKI